ncbi:hypothetical protein C8R43DRAFT_1013358 [Mycena crocata]|nr:hypothetical protein C8R43DRAFT_1013358 [Mycena crocata]
MIPVERRQLFLSPLKLELKLVKLVKHNNIPSFPSTSPHSPWRRHNLSFFLQTPLCQTALFIHFFRVCSRSKITSVTTHPFSPTLLRVPSPGKKKPNTPNSSTFFSLSFYPYLLNFHPTILPLSKRIRSQNAASKSCIGPGARSALGFRFGPFRPTKGLASCKLEVKQIRNSQLGKSAVCELVGMLGCQVREPVTCDLLFQLVIHFPQSERLTSITLTYSIIRWCIMTSLSFAT